MSSGGFIVNDSTPAGIQQAFAVAKIMLMHEDTVEDANSLHGALPSQPDLEQVDIEVTATAGVPTKAKVLFTWDSIGDVVMAGPSAYIDLTPAGTAANKYVGSASMGKAKPMAPAGQTTTGKCYAMVLVDVGTVTVNRIRLHWSDSRGD